MKTLVKLISVLVVASFFASCNLDNTASPATQDIVYSDTSLITGELSVEVLYFDQTSQNYKPAPSGTGVFLYATFEDLQNDMHIYALETTNNNSVYFGFINYGNYYVLGFNNTSLNNYEGVSVVQVRPRRHEVLTLSMYKTATK